MTSPDGSADPPPLRGHGEIEERPQQDSPGPDRAGPDRAGPDRSGPDRAGPDRSGPDRLGGGEWQALAPQSVTVERIASWGVAGVLLVGGAIGVVVFLVLFRPELFAVGLAVAAYAVAAAGLIWSAHFLPAIAYRHTSYQLSEAGFEVRRGIVWRSLITVPHARVQHTDVAQGPLERSFDIGKLIVYTAGTQNSSIELGGLSFQTACDLRDALIRRREASDGV